MNVKKYSNFTEFFNDFEDEFSHSQNQRLNGWFHQIATLSKGCGCTRQQRAALCYKEYRKIGHVLKLQNLQLMKMKFPNTRFEFAEGDELFWVIPDSGDSFSPTWPKDAQGNYMHPNYRK